MKLCIECKHSRCNDRPAISIVYCRHPNLGVNAVDGSQIEKMAGVVRGLKHYRRTVQCGPNGDWHELKTREERIGFFRRILSYLNL